MADSDLIALAWRWDPCEGKIGGGSWTATGIPGEFRISRIRRMKLADGYRCWYITDECWKDFDTEQEAKEFAEKMHRDAFHAFMKKWTVKKEDHDRPRHWGC